MASHHWSASLLRSPFGSETERLRPGTQHQKCNRNVQQTDEIDAAFQMCQEPREPSNPSYIVDIVGPEEAKVQTITN